MMERQPAVAGRFYPSDPAALQREVARCLPAVPGPVRRAVAVVLPHAGYVYSGRVAGETLAAVHVPDTVLLIGPNHHGRGAPVALMASGSWRLPLGTVPIDGRFAGLLAEAPLVVRDSEAHRFEHSLEVQLPLLLHRNPGVRIVPLVLGNLSPDTCEQLGEAVAGAVQAYGDEVLIVASSDMSHYEPRATAAAKDRLAIDRILALDPAGLLQTVAAHRITMCGAVPVAVTLVAARRLGARSADLVRYADSGEVSGDTMQVVGYAGIFLA